MLFIHLVLFQILHLKLSANPSRSIRSAMLYDGSITDFDSRLREFDIGTCLEVFLAISVAKV